MARRRRSTRKNMVRRTARRAFTRRRRRSAKKSVGSKSVGNKIFGALKGIVPFYVFASQLTQKDYQALENTNYKNEDIVTKAKIFTNITFGRLSGFTPFKGANMYGSESTPFTINPSGMINKFTGIGVAGLIYKNLPIKQLPMKGKIGTLAKSTLVSGAIGGLFDAPDNSNRTSVTSSPQVLGKNMSVIQQNRSASMQRGMYSEGNDSTEGSFN